MFSIFVIPGPYDRDDGKVPESIGALGGRKDCRIEGRAEEERKSAPENVTQVSTLAKWVVILTKNSSSNCFIR